MTLPEAPFWLSLTVAVGKFWPDPGALLFEVTRMNLGFWRNNPAQAA
jgi:hypothetical protein